MAYIGYRAYKILKGENLPELTEEQIINEQPGHAISTLRSLSQPLLEMVFCRIIDNFEVYLSDAVREVMNAQPNMLRSNEQVRVDYVLQFTTMDELLTNLIEKKVNELAYLGFEKLEGWFKERMGMAIATSKSERETIVELIETRNLVVHNRAKVNDKYLRNVSNSTLKLGELRTLDAAYLVSCHELLVMIVLSLDARLGNKFFVSESE